MTIKYNLTSLASTFTFSSNLFIYSSGSIPITNKELNLNQTLLGGQSFRWIKQGSNEFIGVLHCYIVHLKHENDQLRYKFLTNNENLIKLTNDNDRRVETALVLHNYFQLEIKLTEIFEKWCHSDIRFDNGHVPVGVRVLAQEPFENLISLICSNNNNIRRLSKMIKLLCDEYGKLIGTYRGITYHQFPTLYDLDRFDLEKRLRELNFGYRARYIHEAVRFLKKSVDDKIFFDKLKQLSTDEARAQLLKITGVSRKVADGVLLMSLGKHDIIPVDTYIHSMAMTFYGPNSNNLKKQKYSTANYNDISSFFQDLWRPMSGWAHIATFSNNLRLAINNSDKLISTSKLSLKRSIDNNEILSEKIFKRINENNSYDRIKIKFQQISTKYIIN